MNAWNIFGRIGLDATEAKRGLDESERAAKRAAKGMETAVDKSVTAAERRLVALGDAMQKVGQKWTTRVTAPIALLSGVILKVAGDFAAGMNRVSALTQATGEEMENLKQLALDLGASTVFSAGEAADAMGFLAQAGFSTTEIFQALPGVMELAAAGQMDLARAADIASNVLTGYGMSATEVGRVNDVLAKTAISANTNVEQLGEAFSFVAPVAAGLGVSFEESAAAIALLSDAGIQASTAGTGLRRILTTLATQSDELGITIKDSAGNMLPFADILDQLEAKAFTTEEALTIFGQRGGPALVALLAQGGSAIRAFSGDLENAEGTAASIAEQFTQGFNGALEGLGGSFETLAIRIADSGLLAWAEAFVLRLTAIVDWIGNLNPVILRWGTIIAGLAAAIGPLLLAIGTWLKFLPLLKAGMVALRAVTVSLSTPLLILAGLALALYTAWDRNFLGIRDVTQRAVAYIGERIEFMIRFGKSLLENWDTVRFAWNEILEAMGVTAGHAGDVIAGGLGVAAAAVQLAFSTMFRYIEDGLQGLVNGLTRALNAAIRSINTIFSADLGLIDEIEMDAWAESADLAADAIDAAQRRIAAGLSGMAQEARYVTGVMANAIYIIVQGMADTTEGAEAVDAAAESAGMSAEEMQRLVEDAAAGSADALDTLNEVLDDTTTAIALTAEEQRLAAIAAVQATEGTRSYTLSLDALRRMAEDVRAAQAAAAAETDAAIAREIAARDELLELIEATAEARAVDAAMARLYATSQADIAIAAEAAALETFLDAIETAADERERVAALVRVWVREAREAARAAMAEAYAVEQTAAAHREYTDSLRASIVLTAEADAAIAAQAAAARELFAAIEAVAIARGPGAEWALIQARNAEQDAMIAAQIAAERELLALVEAVANARTPVPAGPSTFGATRGGRGSERPRGDLRPAGPKYEGDAGTKGGPVEPVETTVKQGLAALAQVTAGMTALGPTINAVASEMPLLAAGLSGFEVEVGSAGEIVGRSFSPMAAFGGILAALVTSSEAFQNLMTRLTETLQPMIERIIGPLVDAFETLLDALWPIIEVALALVETALIPLVFIIETVVAPILTLVARIIASVWNALATAINWALGWLGVNVPLIDLNGGGVNDQTAAELEEEDRKRALEAGDDPGPDPTTPNPTTPNRTPQNFGGTPQAVQLAVATPLVEAAFMMLEAATRMDETLTALMPNDPGGNGPGGMGAFTSALDRLTPTLERLASDGVSINLTGGTGATRQPQRGGAMTALRGL